MNKVKKFSVLPDLQSDSSEYKNLKIRLYLFLSSCLPMTKKPVYSYPGTDPDLTGTDTPRPAEAAEKTEMLINSFFPFSQYHIAVVIR